MELKRFRPALLRRSLRLLIVPYGIETGVRTNLTYQQALLIVPYGIETLAKLEILNLQKLLIVPYGIETT